MYTDRHEEPTRQSIRRADRQRARAPAQWDACGPGTTVAGELPMPTSSLRTDATSRASTPFDLLESHWAVAAIDDDARRRALAVAEQRWNQRRGRQLALDDEDENTAIGILATAYDVAALDILVDATGALATDPGETRGQSPIVAGASRAFTLHGALPLPRADTEAMIYRLLHIASLAVVGHREQDFAEWLELQQPITATTNSPAFVSPITSTAFKATRNGTFTREAPVPVRTSALLCARREARRTASWPAAVSSPHRAPSLLSGPSA